MQRQVPSAKIPRFVSRRTPRIDTIGGNGARDCSDVELTWTCRQQITLLPTSTEELSITPALSFTKDQTQEIKSTSKSKSLKVNCGCEQ